MGVYKTNKFDAYRKYMLGIFIELVISFLLLKYVAGQHIEVLGLKPNKLRIAQLLVGILWPIVFYCLYEFVLAYLVHNPYRLNQPYSFSDFLNSAGYVLRTVAYEELIFRGAMLYLLIEKMGARKALLFSACAFGIYHWFSWQAFGNPVQMLFIFYTTATAGFLFAMAYLQTRSMYLQFGLHFGCNFATMIIFSKDRTVGAQWLVKSFSKDPFVPIAVISITVLIIHFIGFQLFTYWLLKKSRLLNRKK
jgi:uncharacterized protein